MTFNKGDLVQSKNTGRVGIVDLPAGTDGWILIRIIETGEDGYAHPSSLTLLSAKE